MCRTIMFTHVFFLNKWISNNAQHWNIHFFLCVTKLHVVRLEGGDNIYGQVAKQLYFWTTNQLDTERIRKKKNKIIEIMKEI